MSTKIKLDTLTNSTLDSNLTDDDFVSNESFELDDSISDAFDVAIEADENSKIERKSLMRKKASDKRREKNKTKRELGIRSAKQSKFNTRSHQFLAESVSDRAIHVVLQQKVTEVYRDGVDFAPRIIMGIPAFGNASKKNAFIRLIEVQEKIRSARGDNPSNAPKWIVISNDTSIIADRDLITRLEDLKPVVHAASPYGFQQIRGSGRWYDIEGLPEYNVRGMYAQANENGIDWNVIVGSGFREAPKRGILIAHGPFIAVRGETFMMIDFSELAENSVSGFYHYMADISMECAKRSLKVAQIKSLSIQYDSISYHKNDDDVLQDQSAFTSKWQSMLPRNII